MQTSEQIHFGINGMAHCRIEPANFSKAFRPSLYALQIFIPADVSCLNRNSMTYKHVHAQPSIKLNIGNVYLY